MLAPAHRPTWAMALLIALTGCGRVAFETGDGSTGDGSANDADTGVTTAAIRAAQETIGSPC